MNGIHTRAPLPDLDINGLTHDSRQVIPGGLFVALPGLHVQGIEYIPQAIDNGAAVVVGPSPQSQTFLCPYIEVENLPAAYSRMAANFYQHPSRRISVIGITGTNGKTTTSEILAAILRVHQLPTAVIGTLGLRWDQTRQSTGFTTPEANQVHRILSDLREKDIQRIVMEVSSHALKQCRVDDVDFNLAVFTNFSQDHLDYHHDMDDYLESKLRLFHLLPPDRPAIVNRDDPHAEYFIEAAQGPVVTYSLRKDTDLSDSSGQTDLWVTEMGLSLEITVANLVYQDQAFSIESRLMGQYNLENLLAATATALTLGIPITAIQEGISTVTTVPGRLECIPSAAKGRIFIDYAHTPDAYANLLGTIRQLASRDVEIITLFGCGGDRDRAKRPLMAAQAETYSDRLIITSDNPRTESLEQINADIMKGLNHGKHVVINDRREALLNVLGNMTDRSILLILGKGREDYEVIGTEKVYHNDVEIVETYQG
ncbi:MAG: UDP-N-acetylmuramoyl-L-alanyl-D-glutamate--2,6-diaminopimelate ligase [Fidelibacterota bacterium]|nr:MAG: UDP-N-acetylmuramoyl-L-alanyl-D-glutamate--2,6-diaminopimelate ligase [Candidatus Neomarinimicrobiota bacterium]